MNEKPHPIVTRHEDGMILEAKCSCGARLGLGAGYGTVAEQLARLKAEFDRHVNEKHRKD
jgi:hypothetical protein